MVTEGTFPQREGVHRSREVAQGVELPQLSLNPRALLSDYAGDYAFFHHGAFHTWGGLFKDVLQEFVLACPDDRVQVAVPVFDRPVFMGVARHPAEAPWDRAIGVVSRAFWPQLRAHLETVSILDRTRGRFHRAAPYPIQVVDPLALNRATLPDPLPMVDVLAFGLSGSNLDLGFASAPRIPSGLARVTLRIPDEAAQRLARAMLDGHDRPFQEVEQEVRLESHFRPPEGL